MSKERVYVASDMHLAAGSSERERTLCTWLRYAGERSGEIVLNGDVFDFWFEYGTVIPRGHTRLLGTLAELVDGGVKVRMVGGNHDWWGGSFLTQEVGVTFHQEPVKVTLAGHRALLAHGDGLGAGDRGYRLLQAVIRHPAASFLFRWLHPDVGAALARAVSRTEHREERPSPKQQARIQALANWARTRLQEDEDLDLVLLGHTHVPTLEEVRPGGYYVNSGDWLHHRSFVVLDPGAPPRLLRWREESAGVEEVVG